MVAPFLFLWRFIVGDQPWLALGVVLVGLLVVAIRHDGSAWLLLPIVISIILALSLWGDIGLGRFNLWQFGRKSR